MDGRLPPKAERYRTVGALLTIMGVTFIVVGLVRVTDSLTLAETIAYIVSGGIGGVAMLGSGVVLLTSAQLRDQWDTIDRRKETRSSPWTIHSSRTSSSKNAMESGSSG